MGGRQDLKLLASQIASKRRGCRVVGGSADQGAAAGTDQWRILVGLQSCAPAYEAASAGLAHTCTPQTASGCSSEKRESSSQVPCGFSRARPTLAVALLPMAPPLNPSASATGPDMVTLALPPMTLQGCGREHRSSELQLWQIGRRVCKHTGSASTSGNAGARQHNL